MQCRLNQEQSLQITGLQLTHTKFHPEQNQQNLKYNMPIIYKKQTNINAVKIMVIQNTFMQTTELILYQLKVVFSTQ